MKTWSFMSYFECHTATYSRFQGRAVNITYPHYILLTSGLLAIWNITQQISCKLPWSTMIVVGSLGVCKYTTCGGIWYHSSTPGLSHYFPLRCSNIHVYIKIRKCKAEFYPYIHLLAERPLKLEATFYNGNVHESGRWIGNWKPGQGRLRSM